MNILYYDEKMPRDVLQEFAQAIKIQLGSDIIFLPKSFDILLNCSIEQLQDAKNMIESAIALKINQI